MLFLTSVESGRTAIVVGSMHHIYDVVMKTDFKKYIVKFRQHVLHEPSEIYNFVDVDGYGVIDLKKRDVETLYLCTTEDYCKETGIHIEDLIRHTRAEIRMLGESRQRYGNVLRSLGTLDPRFHMIAELIQSIYKKEMQKHDKLRRYITWAQRADSSDGRGDGTNPSTSLRVESACFTCGVSDPADGCSTWC